ncbi:MAG: beta-propeller fold lactonase family protein [Nitrospirales bacterium]|nr:beta-propeller fold lactonase family protein [Nitrospira sp.]MDR4500476.1 beta-propeller fold lactonase family protein [Nitrospirales bacterium]
MPYIFLIMICFSIISPVSAAEYLYIASGNTLQVKLIDQQTGKLREHQTNPLKGAGPITFSPDHRFLYILARMPSPEHQYSIATYRIDHEGKLTRLQNAPIRVRTTYLQADANGQYLIGSHYDDGKMSVWKLTNGVYQGQLVQELTLEKKAHAAVFSRDNRYILVPATGPNKVFQIRFDEKTGAVVPNVPPMANGPDVGARQPRHLVFNRRLNVAYTTQERMNPGVAMWEWDPDKGLLELIQQIVTTKKDVESITTADLHITPDNTFLYISSRDENRERNRIIGFRIDPEDGRLHVIGQFPSEHIPRSFCISKSGKFLYVAGKGEAKLGVYRIDPDNGHLKKVAQYETGLYPYWVTTLVK